MLLTMTLLREGYVTRYLSERLAFGLAPESVEAFFVQRQRWARGAIQVLYLANGPLGRGLTIMQRLLFLPTHWLSLGSRSAIAIVAPVVFLWTGISPVFDVSPADVLYYFVPTVLALSGGVWTYAPRHHSPLAAQVQSTFLSFKILPSVLETLFRPFGHPFHITPKGGTSHTSRYARGTFWAASSLMGITFFGLIVNTIPEWRIIDNQDVMPIVAFWSAINIVVLFLVCMLSLQAPMRRSEERLEIGEPVWIAGASGVISSGSIKDISLSGVALKADSDRALSAQTGDSVRVFITEVGFVAGAVVRQVDQDLSIQFDLPVSVERDLLIRKLFTAGLDTTNVNTSAVSSTSAILKSIWQTRTNMLEIAAGKTPDIRAAAPVEKLTARSLVILPQPKKTHLSEIVKTRRAMAA
jgi:cellulose synthase (UDP-forming)